MDTVESNDKSAGDDLPGSTVSLWIATTPETAFPTLPADLPPAALIIGGGIAGIATAYMLKQAGATVAVVEAGRIVQRGPGNTPAKITALHGLIYDHLISQFGEERARQYADAQQAAIAKIAALAAPHGIDCDLLPADAYTYTESEQDIDQITAEVEAATKL